MGASRSSLSALLYLLESSIADVLTCLRRTGQGDGPDEHDYHILRADGRRRPRPYHWCVLLRPLSHFERHTDCEMCAGISQSSTASPSPSYEKPLTSSSSKARRRCSRVRARKKAERVSSSSRDAVLAAGRGCRLVDVVVTGYSSRYMDVRPPASGALLSFQPHSRS